MALMGCNEDSNILEEQPVDKFGEIYDLNPEDYPEKEFD